MRLALLQVNPTVGALDANAEAIAAAVRRAPAGTDLCITPELALCGYPPRDLLLQRAFVARARAVLDQLADSIRTGPPVLVGLPLENPRRAGRPLINAAALLHRGRVVATCAKSLLPTYDVFDEDRYFEGSDSPSVIEIAGRRCAVSICEDIWNDQDVWQRPRYHRDPIEEATEAGATVVLNLSASPFEAGKQQVREHLLGAVARKHGVPIVYVNQVGGNDDLVFDGRSTVVDATGRVIARGAAFHEDVVVVRSRPAHGCPGRGCNGGGGGDLRGPGARDARLRPQVRFLAGAAGPVGRNRLARSPPSSRARRSAPTVSWAS